MELPTPRIIFSTPFHTHLFPCYHRRTFPFIIFLDHNPVLCLPKPHIDTHIAHFHASTSSPLTLCYITPIVPGAESCWSRGLEGGKFCKQAFFSSYRTSSSNVCYHLFCFSSWSLQRMCADMCKKSVCTTFYGLSGLPGVVRGEILPL